METPIVDAMRKSIFISYRKHDAGSRADLLAEILRDALDAEVFLDQANIAPGDDVTKTIEAPLKRADIVLALVGAKWWDPPPGDASKRNPIWREEDFVRHEIATALRAATIVIPIYLDDAGLLRAIDLPDDVKGLVESSAGSADLPSVGALAIKLREKSFRIDTQPLIDALVGRHAFVRKTSVVVPALPDRPVIGKYLAELIDEFKHLRLPVRDEQGREILPLSAVYVPLRLRRAEHIPGDPETTWEDLIERERVVITGQAGSGKSTLLRYIALQVAASRWAQMSAGAPLDPALPVRLDVRASTSARIPVLVGLHAIADRLTQSVERWLDVIWETLAVNRSVFGLLFERGEILFLFDGLDEVSNPNVRRTVLAGIAKLQRLVNPVHGCNAVVLTCRDAAWTGDDETARFEHVQIQPMDPQKLDEYLGRWCSALWQGDADAVRQMLSQSLRSSQATAEIGGNPQIAATLAMLKHDQALPKQQAVLYELLMDRMIKAGSDAASQTLMDHLMALAVHMQLDEGGDGTGGLDVESANTLLGRRTSASSTESAHSLRGRGEQLLRDLVVCTGVLDVDPQRGLLRAPRFVRFKHRSFQEFLAGRCFAGMFVTAVEPNPLLAHVTNPSWSKVLAFASGVLTTFGDSYVNTFLAAVLGAPSADAGRPPGEEELAQWAPRVAAASICLAELSTYELKPSTLAPARAAHERIVPLLSRTDQTVPIRTRLRIAEGLGAIFDPRLDPAERWAAIPAGSFVRGSSAQDSWIQERPAASVAVADYWIQRWPVTVAEYRVFVEDEKGYETDEWWRSDEGRRWRNDRNIKAPDGWEQNRLKGNCPVTGVSWWEADAFCAWCSSGRTGLPPGVVIRLPTEAQWEKAARGIDDQTSADGKRFPWGTQWKTSLDEENYANCSTTALGVVAPVGLFPAGHSRPYGIWDLAGNVCERCCDGFAPYPQASGSDPGGLDYTHGHVVRGGAFDSPPLNLRISYRFGASRDARDERTGFRCVAVSQRDRSTT